ncbi:copper resistance protein CopC [Saxibacter everestensis]|uniref:Copper resistance protein CopC n=1 Tax=Saxibacter everestensis TaxID=2909229 RepID=A0ABY8QUF8_9MICO|nr:copper resistance protein CopC [Brevibacteriaceae bacterium ZFBP1038]
MRVTAGHARRGRPANVRYAAVVLVALLALSFSLIGGAASAHNVLESTNPEDRSTVTTVPDRIKLSFDQAAVSMGTTIDVEGPAGRLPVSKPELVDGEVSVRLGGELPAGDYSVTWRVTSADGHPISGSFGFVAEQAASYLPLDGAAEPSSSAGTSQSADAESADAQNEGTPSADADNETGSASLAITVAAIVAVVIAIGIIAISRRKR